MFDNNTSDIFQESINLRAALSYQSFPTLEANELIFVFQTDLFKPQYIIAA